MTALKGYSFGTLDCLVGKLVVCLNFQLFPHLYSLSWSIPSFLELIDYFSHASSTQRLNFAMNKHKIFKTDKQNTILGVFACVESLVVLSWKPSLLASVW